MKYEMKQWISPEKRRRMGIHTRGGTHPNKKHEGGVLNGARRHPEQLGGDGGGSLEVYTWA